MKKKLVPKRKQTINNISFPIDIISGYGFSSKALHLLLVTYIAERTDISKTIMDELNERLPYSQHVQRTAKKELVEKGFMRLMYLRNERMHPVLAYHETTFTPFQFKGIIAKQLLKNHPGHSIFIDNKIKYTPEN